MPVTEFLISSRLYPTAIFAATRAMGYPVALEASAEERLTRGLTSMTTYSKLSGFNAYYTLHPPLMYSERMMLMADVRSI